MSGEAPKPRYLRWYFRNFTLGFDECDSLEDAVLTAAYMADDGEEALVCVECWDDEGHRVLRENAVYALAASLKPPPAPEPPRPNYVATVDIRLPDDEIGKGWNREWSNASWHLTVAEAEGEASRQEAVFGVERVRVKKPPPPPRG